MGTILALLAVAIPIVASMAETVNEPESVLIARTTYFFMAASASVLVVGARKVRFLGYWFLTLFLILFAFECLKRALWTAT